MAKAMYTVVGGQTKKVKSAYCVVGGVTRKVKAVYSVVGGATRLVWKSGADYSFAGLAYITIQISSYVPIGTKAVVRKWNGSSFESGITSSVGTTYRNNSGVLSPNGELAFMIGENDSAGATFEVEKIDKDLTYSNDLYRPSNYGYLGDTYLDKGYIYAKNSGLLCNEDGSYFALITTAGADSYGNFQVKSKYQSLFSDPNYTGGAIFFFHRDGDTVTLDKVINGYDAFWADDFYSSTGSDEVIVFYRTASSSNSFRQCAFIDLKNQTITKVNSYNAFGSSDISVNWISSDGKYVGVTPYYQNSKVFYINNHTFTEITSCPSEFNQGNSQQHYCYNKERDIYCFAYSYLYTFKCTGTSVSYLGKCYYSGDYDLYGCLDASKNLVLCRDSYCAKVSYNSSNVPTAIVDTNSTWDYEAASSTNNGYSFLTGRLVDKEKL